MEWKKVIAPEAQLRAQGLFVLAQHQAAALRRTESALADELKWTRADMMASAFGPAIANGEPFQEAMKAESFVVANLADRPPAVPIEDSVQHDHIVCLEDGEKLQMLKRHIARRYGLSPDDYRRKWGLPPDYPMTAPGYSAKRSDFAKAAGLGTSPKKRRG